MIRVFALIRGIESAAKLCHPSDFSRSRPLDLQEALDCCAWLMQHCPISLRLAEIGQESVGDKLTDLHELLLDKLRAGHDWAPKPLALAFRDANEHMLFKLTWV